MRQNVATALRPLQFVATTTDCWSAHGRSYIGVTCHWIDSETLLRSVALACRRLKGSHTFGVIASALEDVHAKYGIRQKVVTTTTDNGSNFVKAFAVFGADARADEEAAGEVEQCTADGVVFEEISAVLDTDDFTDYHLPSHQRCACHSLNLVCTTDLQHAEDNAAYRKLSRGAFGKCQAIWNRAGRSALAVEIIKDNCGLMVIRPNATRWNSEFMAVERLVRISKEKGEDALHAVCNEFDIPK